jgi:hypothetical protein
MVPYVSPTGDPTTIGDANPLFAPVMAVFEQYAQRSQIAMGVGNCWVLDASHGTGVNDQTLFQLMSSGKFTVDATISQLIDDGYIDPSWTLSYALQSVIPNFGLNGAGNVTVADFLQFKAPLGVLGVHVPIAYTQWNKTPDLSLLIQGLQTMRPTFLPKPDGK